VINRQGAADIFSEQASVSHLPQHAHSSQGLLLPRQVQPMNVVDIH